MRASPGAPWALAGVLLAAVVAPVAAAEADAVVLIRNFRFEPDVAVVVLDAAGGNRLTFVNQDFVGHRVVSDLSGQAADGACFETPRILPGQSATATLAPACAAALGLAGIDYHDPLFAFMRGRVFVDPV